jgi:hypothetical protein
MSYDIAVWEGPAPADDHAAAEEYERLSEQEDMADPTPAISAFARDLVARFPEGNEGPWAVEPLTADGSGGFLPLPVAHDRAEDVVPFIAETARAHGIVCFDPQSERLLT